MTLIFPQFLAAKAANTSERDFRKLVDARIVIPTPETRRYGRGKSKLFPFTEVFAALDLSFTVGDVALHRILDRYGRAIGRVAALLHLHQRAGHPGFSITLELELFRPPCAAAVAVGDLKCHRTAGKCSFPYVRHFRVPSLFAGIP